MKIAITIPTRGNDIYNQLPLFCCAQSRKGCDVLTWASTHSAAVAGANLFNSIAASDYDYMFLVDSDVCPPANAIEVMVGRDKDIVSIPTLMTSGADIHWNFHTDLKYLREYTPRPKEGLLEVAHTSFASVLINVNVLRRFVALGESYFEDSPIIPEMHKWAVKNQCTDTIFFCKARALGFKIYMDFSLNNAVHHKLMGLNHEHYLYRE